MSAEKWTSCPKCEDTHRKEHITLSEKLKTAYGILSEKEYNELKAEVETPTPPGYNLSENYKIGIEDETFSVSYTAQCTVCDFCYEFNTHEQINIKGDS